MKREQIERMLDEVSDKHIEEASATKRRARHRGMWKALVAAAMALVLVVGLTLRPMAISAQAVSIAEYPDYEWVYREGVRDDAKALERFFEDGISTILAGSEGENRTYSPINLYMALSVLAELTAGTTREQIISLLNVADVETLRLQANEIWNACYCDDKEQTLLANSLWLDRDLSYNSSVMNTLATTYYTSVYRRELSDPKTARDIRAWLTNNTGNLLKRDVGNAASGFDENTLLVLYSTVFFRAKWSHETEFNSSQNTDGVFHASSGDVTCTYMNHKLLDMNYYWAEDCSAVTLSMKGGNQMWIILPDEGVTVDDLLASGTYMDLFSKNYIEGESGSKYMMVNLSVPKFDIRWSSNLQNDLASLGVTDVFDPSEADFSASVEEPVFISGVNQATRVSIDEEGVKAASYIEIIGATSPQPPDEIIDFVVDRPFLFIIENRYDIPLFAGVVNDPTAN